MYDAIRTACLHIIARILLFLMRSTSILYNSIWSVNHMQLFELFMWRTVKRMVYLCIANTSRKPIHTIR